MSAEAAMRKDAGLPDESELSVMIGSLLFIYYSL